MPTTPSTICEKKRSFEHSLLSPIDVPREDLVQKTKGELKLPVEPSHVDHSKEVSSEASAIRTKGKSFEVMPTTSTIYGKKRPFEHSLLSPIDISRDSLFQKTKKEIKIPLESSHGVSTMTTDLLKKVSSESSTTHDKGTSNFKILTLECATPNSPCYTSYKVRIIRLWNNQVLGTQKRILAFVVIDEKGNLMEGAIYGFNVEIWMKQLHQGSVYIFRRIRIVNAKKSYVIADHLYSMILDERSVVQLIDDDGIIPFDKYKVIPLKDLCLVKPNKASLIDVLGIVVNKMPIVHFVKDEGTGIRSTVDIIDESGTISRITIWGDLATKYDNELQKAYETNGILLAAHMSVSIYQGAFCLSTTNCSFFKFDSFQCEEANKLLRWFSDSSMSLNPFDQISVIIDKTRSSPVETKTYKTKAMVSTIHSELGLSYSCCAKCFFKFQVVGDKNSCNNCGIENASCISRMKIKITITDTIDEIYVTTFGEAAEKILGMTMSMLHQLIDNGETGALKDLVMARLLKTYVFHLVVTKKNHRFTLQKEFTAKYVEEVKTTNTSVVEKAVG